MSVVVITGAGAGVGRASARAFARAGYDVALISRDADRLEAAAADVRATGRRALVLPLDVADAAAVEDAASRTEAELGPIDVWVNGAMTSTLGPVDQLPSDEIRRVTDVTYLGTVYGTQAALRRMRPRERGVIVQVGSGLAYRSVMVHLPAVNTPQFTWVRSRLARAMQPMPPVYQPEIAARAILFVAEHPRREMFVGWQTVLGVLGQRIAPGLMDRYLANRAWEGQMSDDPARPGTPDNLADAVAADVGAHGAFDDLASDSSPLLWADMHRGALAGAAVGVLGLLAAATRRSRRS